MLGICSCYPPCLERFSPAFPITSSLELFMSQLKCLLHPEAFLTTENMMRTEVIDEYVSVSAWMKETGHHCCLLLETWLLHRAEPGSLGTWKTEPEERGEGDAMGARVLWEAVMCTWGLQAHGPAFYGGLLCSFVHLCLFPGLSPGYEQICHNGRRGADAYIWT